MKIVRKRTLLIALVGLTLFGMDTYERRVRAAGVERTRAERASTVTLDAPSDATPALLVPVLGVEREKLVNSFADDRGGGRQHEAIDIMAPRGTPVVAVESGTVRKLFLSARGGLTIYQLAPNGTRIYYYAHLDRYAPGLEEGKRIERGEVIGFVGSTGNAPAHAPHLHFAVMDLPPTREWWKGRAIDPYLLLMQ